MRKYLDEKFARAARIAGNPYFIIFNLIFWIAACIFAQNIWVWLIVWLDVAISIWTLELDLIIVNQNNRQNDTSTEALNTLILLDKKILFMEANHADKLEWLQAENGTIKKQLSDIQEQLVQVTALLIQVPPIKKPRGCNGKFCKA